LETTGSLGVREFAGRGKGKKELLANSPTGPFFLGVDKRDEEPFRRQYRY